jgi:glycosyltransferase involved in cell wall biosynthesis
LFIGDGVERVKLEARVRRLSLSGVKFLGFKGQTELPQYYDLCDVFVLPSERDAWGLVVNEVMNAGKPVVVSDQVGAGPDLVLDGKNGFVTPVGDIHMLTDRLMRLTTDRELARRMGEESFRRVNQWNFESDLQGLLEALGKVVAPVSHVGVKTSLGQIG